MEATTYGTSDDHYTYEPLPDTNGFRPLILRVGSNGELIHNPLENDIIVDSAPYEALS
jgi:hypothetical protein